MCSFVILNTDTKTNTNYFMKPENQVLSIQAHTQGNTDTLKWDTTKTAVIICDMWDRHTCRGAERRVSELVPKINDFVSKLRDKGVLVIHAPSDVTSFYEGTRQRRLAVEAPFVKAPVPIDWNDLDETKGEKYPIVDDDWCDDTPKCAIADIEANEEWPWTRQHPAIQIHLGDAVSDDGQEIYNLMESREIENVIMVGVHLNRCILGRPFGIRQMVKFY